MCLGDGHHAPRFGSWDNLQIICRKPAKDIEKTIKNKQFMLDVPNTTDPLMVDLVGLHSHFSLGSLPVFDGEIHHFSW
jgi:hypothetical protein